MRIQPLLMISLLCGLAAEAAEPVMRVVRSSESGTNLLANADFERSDGGKLWVWQSAAQGYALAPAGGRQDSMGLRCRNTGLQQWSGASQTITLNQVHPAPLVVHGWSKAEEVSGSADNNYAVYVDLTYQDGTPLWGQTARFKTGTHDWERRELLLLPEKPIRSLTVHCLFRNHTGTVFFDDIGVMEASAPGGAITFEGVPAFVVKERTQTNGSARVLSTGDGLTVHLRGDQATGIDLGGRALPGEARASGFLARDAAADSDVFAFQDGSCPDLGLKLTANWETASNHIAVEGRLLGTRGKDRAVTLSFGLPVKALGWKWGDDIRRSRQIRGQEEFSNPVSAGCGATGTMGLYPVAPVFGPDAGLAVALDMNYPAQYRLGYHAGTEQLFISWDFGLVPETQPAGSAAFRFVIFRFDPQWGFRAAFEKFTKIFPAHFRVLSKDQGIWMPFTDISTVQDWQDFGFKYHEGNNNVPWDDANDVLSFRYTEPMTWWMRMAKDTPRTNPEALRARDALAQANDPRQGTMARASITAGMWDDAGQPQLMFRNEPWCDGAVWSLNPNPYLPSAVDTNGYNAATVHWNDSIKARLYGAAAKGKLDGEYLDSLEGYVTADLNFRRDHFRYTTVPLTFDKDSQQPVLFKGLAIYEFTRWISEDVHRLGKLMFANGVPYRFPFLCPWLDVLGTETDWVRQGKYVPVSDRQISLWRTMSGQKPYVLLMNTDYDTFTPEMVERYFQRCLLYGMFPSMFSHNAAENPYWRNPKWYNRDRPLFKKYLPVIKRIAEAGWQPVTWAVSTNANVYVERFGPDADGSVYFTLLNDSDSPQQTQLAVSRSELGIASTLAASQVLTDEEAPADLRFSLAPQEARVMRFQRP